MSSNLECRAKNGVSKTKAGAIADLPGDDEEAKQLKTHILLALYGGKEKEIHKGWAMTCVCV